MAEQEKSLMEVLKAADDGDVKAMREAIAMLEIQGYDQEKDIDIIERILGYKEAMEKAGSTTGYIMMAEEYLSGDNMPKDIEKAIELYQMAADGGEDFGNQCLGMLYYMGNDVPQDYVKAMEYFTLTDKKKSPCTIYALAEMYRLGQGVEIDEEKACELYKSITDDKTNYAELDAYYSRACFRYAQFLHKTGDLKDKERALELVNYAKNELFNKEKHPWVINISDEEILEEWKSLNAELMDVEDDDNDDDGCYQYVLDYPMDSNRFENEIADVVMDLEAHDNEPNDFLTVDFAYEQGGDVVFIQVSPDSEGDNYDLEIARYEDKLDEGEYSYEDNNGRKYKLYLHEPYEDTDARTVIETLRRTMVDDDCPDLTAWRDITEECIKAAEDRARQAAENNQEEE